MRAVPRGEHVLTLKAKAIVVRGSFEQLRAFLYNFASAVQRIVDAIWDLDKLPTINEMHQLFYNKLRQCGYSTETTT